jgi:hypothetical protein
MINTNKGIPGHLTIIAGDILKESYTQNKKISTIMRIHERIYLTRRVDKQM